LLPLQKAPTAKVCAVLQLSRSFGAIWARRNDDPKKSSAGFTKKNANHQTGRHFKTHIVIPSF
jgi:hypothetical protein